MPDIRPEEISLATCDGAGWEVGLACDPCKALFPMQLEALRGHKLFRRPLVYMAKDGVVFRCSRCKAPASEIFVSRHGDGRVFAVKLAAATLPGGTASSPHRPG